MDSMLLFIWLVCTCWTLWRWATSVWLRRGVKQLKPSWLGHVGNSLFLRECEAQLYDKLYRESQGEPAVGLYKIWEPTLLVRSPELIKQILVSDFNSFSDNDVYWEPNDIILSNHPFTTRQDKWKYVRSLSSPAVNPSKIKNKLGSIVATCKDLVQYLDTNQNKTVEAKNLGGHFTTDISAKTIFGVKGDSFTNPSSPYIRFNKEAFEADWTGNLAFTLSTYFPKVSRLFKICTTSKSFENFYKNVTNKTLEYRRSNGCEGNDYIQYLINLNPSMNVNTVTAHSISMLWDVYSTSSIVISHCLDLLADHSEIQKLLRTEIEENIQTLDDITYAKLESMNYLHAFMSEVLRMRTPIPILHKVCTKDTVLIQDDKVFPLYRGDRIVIPIWSLHNDNEHFHQPSEFLPDRFIRSTDYPAYLPFGLGPRTCMGMKFGLTMTKACIVSIVKYFQVSKDVDKSRVQCRKPDLDPKSTFFLIIKNGVWVKFNPVELPQ